MRTINDSDCVARPRATGLNERQITDSAYRVFFFFFNDTATTEIYTLSLHDALPISTCQRPHPAPCRPGCTTRSTRRSEEHTSELQSRSDLVCRLLLEKKKKPNCSAAVVFISSADKSV